MASSGGRTPELRKDAVSNRWVIFSPARAKRPSDFKSKSPTSPNPPQQKCPFCIGQEHECAPEIFRVPPDCPDWAIRVIENLYPALSRNLLEPSASGLDSASAIGNCVLDGFGFHDVVIETPVHSVQLCDLSPEQIGQVLLTYKKRTEQLASHESIKYAQVYSLIGSPSLPLLGIFYLLTLRGPGAQLVPKALSSDSPQTPFVSFDELCKFLTVNCL